MLKQKIIDYSKKIGIDDIGFTDADICHDLKNKLLLQERLGFGCSFQKGTIEERIDPKKLFTDCKTIIVIAMSYHKTCPKLLSLKDNEVYFSSSSWDRLSSSVKGKMQLLVNYIKTEFPNLKYKITVDNSYLCDRTLAYKAGLGFW